MALTKYKLGELLELTTETNNRNKYGPDSVRGMTITKEIIPTKANVADADLSRFLVVHPSEFVFNPRTHGKKIGLGYNNTADTFLISWNNTAFRVKPELSSSVLAEYLFLHFNREEWDREACFRSWGSSTEVFSWDALCDMEINLPPLAVQQKYVAIYEALLANQKSYEEGLDDLKLLSDALLEKFKYCSQRKTLKSLVSEVDVRNKDGIFLSVHGVNKEKQFMPSVANSVDILRYKIVKHGQFACNLMHVGRDGAIPVALNMGTPLIVSPAYTVFEVSTGEVIPEFLLMWLSRNETDRHAWFMSETSVRSGMEKTRFYDMEIPVPSLQAQKSAAEIFQAMNLRKILSEHLRELIKSICPILIKGSLEEGEG